MKKPTLRTKLERLRFAATGLALALVLSPSFADTTATSKTSLQFEEIQHFDAAGNIIEVDVLHINDEVKTFIDRHLKGYKSKSAKAERLHELMFSEQYQNIQYHSGKTKTAQQVFDSKSGNCVGLASLFVAAARYVGLNAYFQSVEVPRDWEPQGDYFVVPGHINVGIFEKKMRPSKVKKDNVWVYERESAQKTVTVNGFEIRVKNKDIQPLYIVEFLSIYAGTNKHKLKYEVITDEQARSEYYNNIAVEHLINNDVDSAVALLEHAVELFDYLGFSWSNLGFAYKHRGDLDKAEAAYLKAIELNKKNISTIKNIYVFYKETNQLDKAAPFKKKVERYNQKNPYWHAGAAQLAMEKQDYKLAINHLKKAIKIKPKEDAFHYQISQAYFEAGDLKRTRKHLVKANKIAYFGANGEDYQSKLEALDKLMH